jgi:hypothetical protein
MNFFFLLIYSYLSVNCFRTELIHLARKSDYMGASIPPAKQWIAKSITTIISPRDLSKQLPPQLLQQLESYDLTVVRRTIPNELNISNHGYGYITDRSDMSKSFLLFSFIFYNYH